MGLPSPVPTMLEIRRRTAYLFLGVMLGQVILISAQVPTRSGPHVLQAVALSVFSRVQRVTSALTGAVGAVWSGYVDLRHVRQENDALRRQVADLQVRLQEERAQALRAGGLQRLLGFRSEVSLPTLAAEVIAGDATPGFQTITIDRGRRDGVLRDMAVIGPDGVIGRIVGDPVAHASQVQLIIGKNAAAGAMLERTRTSGLVTGGAGDPPLTLEYVSNLTDVQEGDLVVTSGIDGIYPKGFALGRVESATRGTNLYQVVKVRPAVDFTRLEEVLVVLTPPVTAGREGRQ
jgi:rod shape-determining protein MreC